MAIQALKVFNKKTVITLFVVAGVAASLFLNWGDFVSGFYEGLHAGE